MESNPQPTAAASVVLGGSPSKPWERRGTSSAGPTPFKPPSSGSTSGIVEASGTAKPGEIVTTSPGNTAPKRNAVGRPVPTRPWERQNVPPGNRGYGCNRNYNSGMYGNNMYRGGYGYGGQYGGPGMYNGGQYGGPYGGQDGESPSSPSFWVSFLRVMQGVVNIIGRVSFLIDQNAQAFHMFMTALLQLFDRSGLLYGELARFVLRLLGIKSKPRKTDQARPREPHNPRGNQGPQGPQAGAWDNVWRGN